MKKVGKVYLVGAGPGDPGLLTVEALRLLQTADAVFHDDLVSREILALIPSETYVESVGKRCGHASVTQQQIHSLLVNAAKEGRKVVRLKSGDALIYGRAGEEIEALRSAGIEYAIVPGITAALGAAARAGIPLTDRRAASRIVFLSNHQCAGKPLFDWKGALSDDTTALIYMPGTDYEGLTTRLCADGLAPETPCLVISQATTKQKVHPTTLANLTDAPHNPAPVLLIVGAVAAKYSGELVDLPDSDDSIASPPLAFEFALANERAAAWEEPPANAEPAIQSAARNIELTGLEFA
ncbi:MAG: uroporphyrinogen-III C-methyltransferase [Candidatus Acidiferrales bacterium]